MNNFILAAKLRRLATELESVQQATQQIVASNRFDTRTAARWGGVSARAFNNALKVVIANFRFIADSIKPPRARKP